jgi:hypothetical protein
MLHHSRELEPIFWEFFAKCTFLKEKTERIESLPDCIALGKVIKALKEELKVRLSSTTLLLYLYIY